METSRNRLRGIPSGSQVLIGSLPNPPGTARGPYTGFAASNLAFPQGVMGGVSLLMVRTPPDLLQTPERSCGSCGTETAGGAGALPFPFPCPCPNKAGATPIVATTARAKLVRTGCTYCSGP